MSLNLYFTIAINSIFDSYLLNLLQTSTHLQKKKKKKKKEKKKMKAKYEKKVEATKNIQHWRS